MKSFEFVTYKGKQIAVVDFANTTPEESIAIMREAERQIALLPPKSALVLTDATNAVYNRATAAALKDLAKHDSPFVKASAAVGVEGMLVVLAQSVVKLTGRHFQFCKNRTEAMEWLISQK
jgi:hypothetical protein